MHHTLEHVQPEIVHGAERSLPEQRVLRVAGDEARGEERGERGGIEGVDGGDFGESGEERGERVDGDGAAEPAAEDGPVLGQKVGFQELDRVGLGPFRGVLYSERNNNGFSRVVAVMRLK